jgi:iron complex outermembrane recepter protein
MKTTARLGATVLVAGVLLAGAGRSRADETPASTEDEKPLPTTLEEHVVVSDTVATDRRDPATFTDLDRDAILWRDQGQDLSTFLGETVNAYAYSDAGNGYGYSYLRIRGFDQTRIAVNINGVPLNTPESHQVYTIDLGDFAGGLDLVQIQRGPGTARYGSPAVGGVVNLETAPLSATAGGLFEASYGSFGTSRVAFRYGGPVGKTRWAWVVRAAHAQSDGYRDGAWSRQTLLQVGFERFDPDSVWRILLFGGPEATQLSYYGVPHESLDNASARRSIAPLRRGETDTFVQPQLQVVNDRRVGPGLFLKNTWYAILGYGYYRQHADLVTAGSGTFGNAWEKRALDNRQIGWIPRLTWNHPRGELTAGMELLFHRGTHEGKVTDGTACPDPPDCTAPGAPVSRAALLYDYTNAKDTVNVFVRESLRVSRDATVNLELQASHHRFAMRDDKVRGLSWDGSYAFLSPRVGVNWNVSDRWNVYAQAVQTESEPPFNNVWNPEDPADDPTVHFLAFDAARLRYSDPVAKPERLRSYEAGAGYRHGARYLKADVYRMDFRDELVYAGGLDADGIPITENAGRSLHQGVEIDAGGRLPGDVDLSGYFSFSRDLLKDYTIYAPLAAGGVAVIDYSGNRIALFPDSLFRLAVSRRFGPVRVEVSGRRVGTIYLDNSQNERKTPANRSVSGYVDKRIEPFSVLAAQAVADLSRLTGSKSGSLTLRLRVDNLLDARYAQFGYSYPVDDAYTQFYSEFFPAATRSVMVGVSYGF